MHVPVSGIVSDNPYIVYKDEISKQSNLCGSCYYYYLILTRPLFGINPISGLHKITQFDVIIMHTSYSIVTLQIFDEN